MRTPTRLLGRRHRGQAAVVGLGAGDYVPDVCFLDAVQNRDG